MGFSVLQFVPFFRSVFSVFVRKNFDFSVLVPVAVFCSILLSVSGFRQNEIGLLDLPFNAVWWFSGLSSGNLRLNDVNHMHVFSGFARGFGFD